MRAQIIGYRVESAQFTMEMRTACLVYNPTAGRYPSGLLAEHAANLLREHGWKVSIKQSFSGPHITELANQAASDNLDAFFIVGGDGSLNFAASGLVHTQTALGVLPAGTTNVWAQELGLTSLGRSRRAGIEDSALKLVNATVRSVDVGMCNDRVFLLWAGVGLDAFVVHRLEPRSRWEKYLAIPSYAMKAAWNATQWHGINLNVEVDGTILHDHYLLGVVSNVRRYAGGLTVLSPESHLDDGVLDLWLFKGDNMTDILQTAVDLLSGRHTRSGQVQHTRFHQLRLECGSQMFIQVDGEPYSSDAGITISVLPKALRVLIPTRTPYPLFCQEAA